MCVFFNFGKPMEFVSGTFWIALAVWVAFLLGLRRLVDR
jgi:hypothetical protein